MDWHIYHWFIVTWNKEVTLLYIRLTSFLHQMCTVNEPSGILKNTLELYHLRMLTYKMFWDTALCSLVEVDWHFRGVYFLSHQGNYDGGSMHLWNVGLLWDYMAQYPRRLSPPHSPLRESEVSQWGLNFTLLNFMCLTFATPRMVSPPCRKHFVAGWGGLCAPMNSNAMPVAA
jgi:hypothetical protein